MGNIELENLQVSLLTHNQVKKKTMLRVLKNYGLICDATHLAKLLDIKTYENPNNSSVDTNNYAAYSLRYSKEDDGTLGVFPFGGITFIYDSHKIGIRPVITFDNFYSVVKDAKIIVDHILDKNDVLEVELGEYPQYVLPSGWQKELERAYQSGKMSKTSQKFSLPSKSRYTSLECTNFEVYEYGGLKYVRYVNELGNYINFSRNYPESFKGEVLWMRVDLLKWLVDMETKTLISKHIILGNVPYYDDMQPESFEETRMNDFLNNVFLRDAFPHQKLKKDIEAEENKSKTEKLLDEIYSLLKEIPIESVKENISTRVEQVVASFNEKADKIKEAKEKGIPVIENLEAITYKLDLDLEIILEELKEYYNSKKVYYDLISKLDDYIDIVNGEEAKDNDELSKDLRLIVTTIIPFLKDEDADNIKAIFLGVFTKEKDNILNYTENDNSIEYSNIESMELYLRKKLQPVLELLLFNVNNRDIENEIKESMNNIIMGLYKEPENRLLASILGEVNKYYSEINALLEDFPEEIDNNYREELKEIMEREIDYSKGFVETAKELQKIMSLLEVLKGKIEKDKNEYIQLESSHIDLSKYGRQESANID